RDEPMLPLPAGHQCQLGLQVLQGPLGPFEDVVHRLPADSVLLGDLAQGEIIVMVQLKERPLFVSEQLTVEIVEQMHADFLVSRHGAGAHSLLSKQALQGSVYRWRAPFVKQTGLWQTRRRRSPADRPPLRRLPPT